MKIKFILFILLTFTFSCEFKTNYIDFMNLTPPTVTGESYTTNTRPTWHWKAIDGVYKYRYSMDGNTWTETYNLFYTSEKVLSYNYSYTFFVQARYDDKWSESGIFTTFITLDIPNNYYTITFDSSGGSAVSDLSIEHGEAIPEPVPPVNSGYIFGGWFKDASYTEVWDFGNDVVTFNMTLYAKWDMYSYTISFDDQGADVLPVSTSTVVVSSPQTTIDAMMPTAPEKTGTTFAGWFEGTGGTGNQITSSTVITGNMTIYAHWTTNPVYTVTFKVDGATIDTRDVTSPATTVSSMPTIPIKTGYTFIGWEDISNNPFTDTTTVTANITVSAIWSINTYTITYDGNGSNFGTIPFSTNAVYNNNVTIESQGTMELRQDGISYRLVEWNTLALGGGTVCMPGDSFTVTADMTLYAQWDVIGGTGPAGGIVFHDKGSVSDGWRYMEVSPISGQWNSVEWGIEGVDIATSNDIGEGAGNTALIVDSLYNTHTGMAAQLASEYTLLPYSDWFLPSLVELREVYDNLKLNGIGTFLDNAYWSSSQSSSNAAMYKYFLDGTENTSLKTNVSNVRAVRAFKDNNPTYSIRYIGNDNTGGFAPVDKMHYQLNDTSTVLGNLNGLTKDMYVFDGWAENPDGSGQKYNVGDTITVDQNKILYAIWKINYVENYVHVSSTGDDGNTGLSGSPLLTIQEGLDRADYLRGNGAIIHGVKIQGGNYNVSDTITLYPGIDLTGSWDAGFTTQDFGATRTIITDTRTTGASPNPLPVILASASVTTGLTINNIEVSSGGTAASGEHVVVISINGAAEIRIHDCILHGGTGIGSSHGMFIQNTTAAPVIYRNRIYSGTASNGIRAININNSSPIFYSNDIVNEHTGGNSYVITTMSGANANFINNNIISGFNAGASAYGYSNTYNTSSKFFNNNIFMYSTGSQVLTNTSGTNAEFYNNNLFSNSGSMSGDVHGYIQQFSNINFDLVAAGAFTDPSNKDFRYSANVPNSIANGGTADAIVKNILDANSIPHTDINGISRTDDGGLSDSWSIGAHEYDGAGVKYPWIDRNSSVITGTIKAGELTYDLDQERLSTLIFEDGAWPNDYAKVYDHALPASWPMLRSFAVADGLTATSRRIAIDTHDDKMVVGYISDTQSISLDYRDSTWTNLQTDLPLGIDNIYLDVYINSLYKYMAFTAGANTLKLYQFDGSDNMVTKTFANGSAVNDSFPEIIEKKDGGVRVAYIHDTNGVSVVEYSDDSLSSSFTYFISGSESQNPRYVCGDSDSNNIMYVGYIDHASDRIRIYRKDASWVEVGDTSIMNDAFVEMDMEILGNTVYIGYINDSNRVEVFYYNGFMWNSLGPNLVPAGVPTSLSLEGDGNSLFVSFIDNGKLSCFEMSH